MAIKKKTKNKSTGRRAARKAAPKKKAAKRANPAKALRAKLTEMKPGRFYTTKVSGVKAKVKRNGNTLTVRFPKSR